jgi:anaerobic magnesium-protoporphyrin IX monomethyl ester cyclase
MRVALVSGLGPESKSADYQKGSLLSPDPDARTLRILDALGEPEMRLGHLRIGHGERAIPLLRPAESQSSHLTTVTLESILDASDCDYTHVPTSCIWAGLPPAELGSLDAVLLSTTYIWNPRMLAQAIRWIAEFIPGVPVVAGGQYTNLKFRVAMTSHPELLAVIRGDAEIALPMLLARLSAPGRFAEVPNLVWRDDGSLRVNDMHYLDLEDFPSPALRGHARTVPYESMRGCPFDCAFCSFPLATSRWRYKSARKIRSDWISYAETNGATSIEAMDSTFTVPPTRLRELFRILPDASVPWECYSRANVITSAEFIDNLLRAHCFRLVIGFESMNDLTLKDMSKRVRASQNRRAFELLRDSGMDYSICFIVGYPGEDEERFGGTRDFLVNEFAGRFQLHLFGMSDETMPLWSRREEFGIQVADPYDSDTEWSHTGMSSAEARALRAGTLDEVRRQNDKAVLVYWQGDYQSPVAPGLPAAQNLAIEKAVERLAMVGRDCDTIAGGCAQARAQLDTLRAHGCVIA